MKNLTLGFLKKVEDLIDRLCRTNTSLRSKLLAMFLVVGIPFLLFVVFTYSITGRTLASQIEDFQRSVVNNSQKLVEHYVLNCQKGIIILGNEPDFRHSVAQNDTSGITTSLKRVFNRQKTYSFMGVVKRGGTGELYMASAYPGEYMQLTSQDDIYDFFEYYFANPRNVISSVYEYRGEREVIIAFPMRGALLIGGVDIGMLADLLDKAKPDEKYSYILMDRENRLIIGDKKTGGGYDGREGFVRSRENVAYYVKSSAIDWIIALSSPKSYFYRSAVYLRRLALAFLGVGILTAAALAAYFSKKITSPISELNRGARILGEGNYGYRINIKTGDELEGLAKEFNNMADHIKKSYSSLEEKVRIATQDLKDAYVEIEEKNRELKKADRLKSEFLASMSHELRTPMNAIIGFTSLLQDETYGRVTEKQKNTYKKIMKNTKHLMNLINDILDLSKIEAGKMELIPERFNVRLMLAEILEEIRPLAREKGLSLDLEADEDIQIYNDYTRLRQVVMNLLSNAVKFTKKGGVSVRCENRPDRVVIEVEDSGIGIKECDLKKIFSEFVQSDGSITREFGGSGLGLSIVQKLTKMMGGEVEVESTWQKGTLFRVFLPCEMSFAGKKGGESEGINS